jgi:hypothetical protein
MKLDRQFLYAFFLTLSACTTANHAFQSVIIEQGVDMQKFKADRSACEQLVTEKPSNLESTNSLRFRECLINKGYRLMS